MTRSEPISQDSSSAISKDNSQNNPKNNPEKAAAILAGALEVFSEHGYAAASMERIAKTAGVSKPTLYKYFRIKKDCS